MYLVAVNSRAKGVRGELELRNIFREHGYDARRGQQYCGISGDADVVGLPGIHVESKWVERLNIRDAMAQSIHDARYGEIPTVMHKKNHCEWLVTLRLEDFMDIYREWEVNHG